MSKSMETNTAAIYLRRSTEDDGKSVGQQERTLRSKAEDLAINIVAVYGEDEDETVAQNDKNPRTGNRLTAALRNKRNRPPKRRPL